MTRTSRMTWVALSAAALMGACATNTTPPQELVSARTAVRSAEADPLVLSRAPQELKRATDALQRANELNAKGESLAEISTAAYVAQRHAEAAKSMAAAAQNEENIRQAQLERERVRADARDADARRAEAQAASAQALAANAQSVASTARAEAANAQAAAVSTAQRNAELEQQLAELKASKTDRGMLVTLGDVLFEFGRADIKPSARDAMAKLAAYLQQHPERRILIEGFTDSVGSESANLTLSQRRADAVAAALVALGISPTRIGTRGYGEDYPVAENTTDTNRALNRRVEVYISNTDQPVRARG